MRRTGCACRDPSFSSASTCGLCGSIRPASECRDDRTENRYVEIAPTDAGLAGVWAQLHATDGVALDQKLDGLAHTVCAADPRSKQQRRADALAALIAGLPEMRCECGSPDCSAAQRRPATDVVIHVLAEQATIVGDSQSPGYLAKFGPVASTTLRDMATTAKLKPLVMPSKGPERGYRPSSALAEFVRCRDLTCRFPGCDQPADVCDLDHTVPFPAGPTHASNLKLLCRYHHLLKTFYSGCGRSSAARRHRHVDRTHRPHLHHYARRQPLLSCVGHVNRRAEGRSE